MGKKLLDFGDIDPILMKFYMHIDIDDLAQGITKCLLS